MPFSPDCDEELPEEDVVSVRSPGARSERFPLYERLIAEESLVSVPYEVPDTLPCDISGKPRAGLAPEVARPAMAVRYDADRIGAFRPGKAVILAGLVAGSNVACSLASL